MCTSSFKLFIDLLLYYINYYAIVKVVVSNFKILRNNNLTYSTITQKLILHFKQQDNSLSLKTIISIINNQLVRKNMFSINNIKTELFTNLTIRTLIVYKP